jgi:DNA polymerase-3 subunit beta
MIIYTGSLKQAFTKVEKIKGEVLGYSIQVIEGKAYLVKSLKTSECRVLLDTEGKLDEIDLTQKVLKTLSLVKESVLEVNITDRKITTNKRMIKLPKESKIHHYIKADSLVESIIISTDEYKTLMQTTDFIASDDIRPILKAVSFNNGEVCSLDGYRLCLRKGNFKLNNQYNVDGDLLKNTLKVIDKTNKIINIDFSKDYAVITIDNTVIISKLIEGAYVKYHQLLPEDYNTKVVLDVKELLEECNFLYKITEDYNHTVKFAFNDKCILSDLDNTTININGYHKDGDSIDIAINNTYLIGTLKYFGESVTLEMESNLKPIIFKSDRINGLNLVLPIRLMK